MRSMWKGAVSFGLVSIPVNLYAATENKSMSFHQVHAADGGRITTKRFCTAEDTEVPYSDIVKGHETPDGQMVMLSAEDFTALPVPSAKTVEVLEFVPLEAIDPIFFDKSYFLEPQAPGLKPYVLLRDALHKSGQVAIAKIALRQRESLAVLRVHADVLILNTMLWPAEVRTPDFAFLREDTKTRPQEMDMAGSLIESLSDEVFDPSKYTDTYQEALEALIASKLTGHPATPPTARANREADVIDLMSRYRPALPPQNTTGSPTQTHPATPTATPTPARRNRQRLPQARRR